MIMDRNPDVDFTTVDSINSWD